MTMIYTISVLLLLLAGCSQVNTAAVQTHDQCLHGCTAATLSSQSSEALALLIFRREQCALGQEKRDLLVQQYVTQSSQQAVMKTLMLASCVPDQTPGLLVNTLAKARNLESLSPDIEALLDLFAAQAESYALLERRWRSTQKKLDDMISGLRTIETEMGEPSGDEEIPDPKRPPS